MNKKSPQKKDVGTLVDIVDGVEKDNPLDIEIAINPSGRIVMFHDKDFKEPLSWYEYNVDTSKLQFILENGISREFGRELPAEISKYMHNTHQILTVFMDDITGEAKRGTYIPLMIHHN